MSNAEGAQSGSNEAVLLKVANGIATITLNRPKQGNAINNAMLTKLIEILEALPKEPNVRVVVLTGAGNKFCSGMDLSASNQAQLKSSTQDTTTLFIKFCETLKHLPLPVISLINGPVLGGGNVLLFLSDIRIMASDAWIQFSEVYRGLVPAMISCYIVPRAGGLAALDLFLTGRRLDAEGCKAMGFVTEVAKDNADLVAKADKFIQYFLTAAPGAIALCKNLIHHVLTHSHEQNVEEAKKVFVQCVKGPEMHEGVKAFKDKRKPSWVPGAFPKNLGASQL